MATNKPKTKSDSKKEAKKEERSDLLDVTFQKIAHAILALICIGLLVNEYNRFNNKRSEYLGKVEKYIKLNGGRSGIQFDDDGSIAFLTSLDYTEKVQELVMDVKDNYLYNETISKNIEEVGTLIDTQLN